MTKSELERQVKEQQEIIEKQAKEQKELIEKHKAKVKAQNESAKGRWDTVSCRLPVGTKKRIEAQGLSINGLINKLVLAELDRLENGGVVVEPIQPIAEPKPQNVPKPDIYEQNELLHQKQKEMAELRVKQVQEEEPKETKEERIERLKHEQVILEELKAKNGIVEQGKEFLMEQSKIKASIEEEPPF